MLLEAVQTTLCGAKVKENKMIKVFGRSPQALYYLYKGARERQHPSIASTLKSWPVLQR